MSNLTKTKLTRLITHPIPLCEVITPFMSFIATNAISKIHFSKQAIQNPTGIVMQLFPRKKVKMQSTYNLF